MLCLSVLVLLHLPHRATAQEAEVAQEEGWHWELDLGLALNSRRALLENLYEQDDGLNLSVLLSGGAYYKDFFIESNPTTQHPLTLGYVLHRDSDSQLNLVVESFFFTIDDRAGSAEQLQDIRTRENSVEGGIEYVGQWGKYDFRTRVLHDLLSNHGGIIASFEVARPIFTRHVFILPTLGVTYISNDATDYYFGVENFESTPQRPEYHPGSAMMATLSVYLERPLSESWSVVGFAGYSVFDSAITDSPIVQPRKDAYNIGFGVLWSF